MIVWVCFVLNRTCWCLTTDNLTNNQWPFSCDKRWIKKHQSHLLYQTCQVRWFCLGTPSFDKGYCRPSIDPVAKFLPRQTTIINFGKTNEIYKLPETFFAFLDTSHCFPHPMLIQVAANLLQSACGCDKW